MKKVMFAIGILILPFTMQAQLGNLLNKAKNKVQQRADAKVDQAMDKSLDDAEAAIKSDKSKTSKTEKKSDTKEATDTTNKEASSENKLTAYSKFDFVPGEKIIYSEDFSQDAIGELPLTWNSSGKGEVMTLGGKTGKWVRGYQQNTLLSGNAAKFGENYTIEFDMIYSFNPKVTGYLLPETRFGIYSSGDKDGADNSMLRSHDVNNEIKFVFHPGTGDGLAQVVSYLKRGETFRSDNIPVAGYQSNFNKVIHYSIQVQKTRVRLWLNDTKLFDIPRAANVGDVMNNIYFEMEGSNYKDDEIGYYVSDIRVANGVPDARHKLIDEGKYSTSGILFDVNSATIKPESFGVIKDIAAALQENPTVSVKIIGHTSNDGDAAANITLSEKRAAAVKEALIKKYSIDESRLKTEGKGASQPIADNKTAEGKAQNRRVEFVKL